MTEANPRKRRPPTFELIGGNVCLDFINTLDDRPSDHPKELLTSYDELARFGEDSGILTPEELGFFHNRVQLPPHAAEHALLRARNLRAVLNDQFSAVLNKPKAL